MNKTGMDMALLELKLGKFIQTNGEAVPVCDKCCDERIIRYYGCEQEGVLIYISNGLSRI